MAGTMNIFYIRKKFFSQRKKNLLFLPCKTSIATIHKVYLDFKDMVVPAQPSELPIYPTPHRHVKI